MDAIKLTSWLCFSIILLLLPVSHAPAEIGAHHHHGAAAPRKAVPPSHMSVEFQAGTPAPQGVREEEAFPARFRVLDGRTGEAVSNLKPSAWFRRRDPGGVRPDQEGCNQMVRTYSRKGILKVPADADLNGFLILTLNADNSIGIYDPTVNLKTSNLLDLIPIDGKAGQWLLDQERGMVYVTVPDGDKVAVVDVRMRSMKGSIPVGKTPVDIVAQPNSKYIWVANQGSGSISVIDRLRNEVFGLFEIGPGPITISFDAEGRTAFLGSPWKGQVHIIDTADFEETGRAAVGQGLLSMAYSAHRRAAYAAGQAGDLFMIVPGEKKASRFNLPSGITKMAATPDGRYLLALVPARQQAVVIDTDTHRVTGIIPTAADPDQIAFTPDFAYIRNRSSVDVTIIQLSELESAQTAPVANIPIGIRPPAAAEGLPGVMTMAGMHHGGHTLILNPADSRVYMYMEGMMAPMDSFKVYTDRPLGILMYDLGLKEAEENGVYESTVFLKKPGTYDVSFFIPEIESAQCFELEVAKNPDSDHRENIEPVFSAVDNGGPYRSGEKSRIRLALRDKATDTPLSDITDLRVMSFRPGGHWQQRAAAVPAGEGLYEAAFTYPESGRYYVLIESPSLGVALGDLGHAVTNVGNAETK